VSPEETLDRVRPLFGRIGLTRLADITGLDSVGIPVVLSVRPQSGYLSVDGGKGFTPVAAAASAAMECVERHAGEQTPVECFTSPHADLPEDARIDVSELPLSRNSLFSTRSPQAWTWAEDILGEHRPRVAVPSVMVSLERHRHRRSSTLPFHFSSNGLNSGNTPAEAVVGGLYEVIERDATTCTKVSWDSGAPMRRVDLRSAGSSDIALLLERIHRAGLEVVVVDCTVDTAVPTFCAYLCDVENPAIGLYHGYGTHLDPQVAVIAPSAKPRRAGWSSSPAPAMTRSATIAACTASGRPATNCCSPWNRRSTCVITRTGPPRPSRPTAASCSSGCGPWVSPASWP
jgi:ribosomal protein S12 methylthiotransferase accessory factor